MVVDYSKWDNLELSDDSDVEVHPNVDKKSFIRWKQRDIHEKREQHKMEIEGTKLTIDMHKALLVYIQQLKEGKKIEDLDGVDRKPGDVSGPSYKDMLGALLQRGEDLETAMKNIKADITKDESKIAQWEKEDAKKITSEGVREGFSRTIVSKKEDDDAKENRERGPTKEKTYQTIHTPSSSSSKPPQKQDAKYFSSDDEEDASTGKNKHIQPSLLARKFALLKYRDYSAARDYLLHNQSLLSRPNESDGLMIDAYRTQMNQAKGKKVKLTDGGKRSVEKSLLITYCKQVGASGINSFFARLISNDEKSRHARKIFEDDVEKTFADLCEKAKSYQEEDDQATPEQEGVEQIQLQQMEGAEIKVEIPPIGSEEYGVYQTFSAPLQEALEIGTIEAINVVLAKMKVEEAESIVSKLSNTGMLNVEERVIDTTIGETIPGKE